MPVISQVRCVIFPPFHTFSHQVRSRSYVARLNVCPFRSYLKHSAYRPRSSLQVVLAQTLQKTYRPRNSSCLSLFPFPLSASICADLQTPLQPGIFRSEQALCALVSREPLSSLRELPSH